jgi:hypothetical protein
MLILVEDSAQTLASSDVQVGELIWVTDRRRQRKQRPSIRDALVRPVGVVEGFELTQGAQEVALVPDQDAVKKFSLAGLHTALSR